MINNLFYPSQDNNQLTLELARQINGLQLYHDFITPDEQDELLQQIDTHLWLNDLSRRVQHYGYKYDYKTKRIDSSLYLGGLPTWLMDLAKELLNKQIIDFIPDQVIINEYTGNQGIAHHIDCTPCFEDCIVSISLGGSCIMDFIKNKNSEYPTKISLLLPPRTLLIMKGESRYNWYHGIAHRKNDIFNGTSYPRTRRVSITFRKVIL